MTVGKMREAIESHRPFDIRMADGKVYHVAHPDFIAFTRKRTSVLVSHADDRVQILPLLTMTGITYTPRKAQKE